METLPYKEMLVRQMALDGHGMTTMVVQCQYMRYFTCHFMGATGWGPSAEEAEDHAIARATRLGLRPDNYLPELSGIKPTP